MEFTQESGNMKLEIQHRLLDPGYDIKITSKKMLGTLHLRETGFSFSPPNKKKQSSFFVPWEQLESLIKVGENFQNAWDN